MIEVNGIAHIALTVNHFEACVEFYSQLLPFLGLQEVASGNNFAYYIGGHTAIGITRCDELYKNEKFVQTRIGLHHLCFRARERSHINEIYRFLQSIEATIIHPPEEGPWAPGYYSILFEDPDGIRLEVNYVPGKGVLEKGVQFNPAGHYT